MSRRSAEGKKGGLAALATVAAALGCAGAIGCGADDNATPALTDASMTSTTPEGSTPKEGGASEAAMAPPSMGQAAIQISSTLLDFATVPCGDPNGATQMLNVTNNGSSTLAVAAKTTGAAFAVSPTALTVAPGASGSLNVTAMMSGAATAGSIVMGSLGLFTNDPTRASITIPLSATAAGATLALQPGSASSFEFPTTAVGGTSAPITVNVVNTGNAPATFTFGLPSDPEFSFTTLADASAGVLLNPGDVQAVTAQFVPTTAAMISATSAIGTTSMTCGTNLASLSYAGQGGKGTINGWPATVDFGPAPCGSAIAPAQQSFSLTNSGPADAHITSVSITGSPGFTTSAKPGRAVYANGGILAITVNAPAVPANSPTTPVTATLTIETDADTSPHTITLTEQPSGAVLAFETSETTHFGSFGPVVLLKSTTQDFKITNTGTAPADVTLTVIPGDTEDLDAGEAGAEAAPEIGGGLAPFILTSPSFTLNGPGEQDETVVFTPSAAQPVTGSIAVTASGAICGTLPAPIPLSGSGLGGGPTVVPTSLTLGAVCGGSAPTAQTFLVRNDGTADFTWSLALGAGVQLATTETDAGTDAAADVAANAAPPAMYTISASPPPGLLIPGASSLVTVHGTAIPTGGANPDPSAYAAQVTITTDVPLDPPHTVSIRETPLGDQISLTGPTPLRFGQIPIGTTIAQMLLVSNFASAGSPAANLSFVLSGPGAAGYTMAPAALANLASGIGASSRETLTFAPTLGNPYPATLTLATNDALCTPLPAPMTITGTGTNGQVSVSTQTMVFGTDPGDQAGLVNCGAQGLGHSFTVTNLGNQAMNITGLALGLGASSPYKLSGSGTLLPAALAIGASASITVTPGPIPQAVANPSDASPFTDTLTITTDAAGDTPHVVKLTMQARGAVILDTPLTASWPFGTITFGSIGTFTNSIWNAGNSGVTIGLTGLAQPTIFGLQNSRTKVPGGNPPAGIVTSVTSTFAPSSSNGSWTDRGTLVVVPDQALCQPLPMQWAAPMVTMTGASNNNPAVTVSGSLVFPTTACGSAAPPAQTVTLANATNVAYPYSLAFSSGGKYYSTTPAPDAGAADAGAGLVPANGSAQILVTPRTVTPGQGVLAGSAPYADELLITVHTTPPTPFTIPISWTLDGAVLALAPGFTKTDGMGHAYYPVDSSGSFSLPIVNQGTAGVSITYGLQPAGAFSIAPTPTNVTPTASGAPAIAPFLTSGANEATCPALTVGSVAFFYDGAVCQPLPASALVEACTGILP